jgi:Protein of unknown function (DUF3237)
VRLEPLYTLRFFYPDGWGVVLDGAKGAEELDFYFAEGRAEGRISGVFRGANHPRKRTDESYAMNLQGFIETDDAATIMLDYRGYGRSRKRSDELYQVSSAASELTRFRRQVVGFARHLTSSPKYSWLNDSVCAISGEVRAPVGRSAGQYKQADVKLVFSVSELVWESPPE